MTDGVAYPLFRRGSAGNPPPPPPGGGGGGESGSMVAAGPSPIPSEKLAVGSRDSASPWGGLSRQLLVRDRQTLPTCFWLRSFLLRLWLMPLGLSLILAPWALPQSNHYDNPILICDKKYCLFYQYSCYFLCRYSVDISGLGLSTSESTYNVLYVNVSFSVPVTTGGTAITVRAV